MKRIWALIAFGFIISCAQPERGVSPDPGIVYKLTDPVTGESVGTVDFDDNGGYLRTVPFQESTVNGVLYISVSVIGHWNRNEGGLVLNDKIYQESSAYDRWGNPVELDPEHLVLLQDAVPLPDCRKVIISGEELILL